MTEPAKIADVPLVHLGDKEWPVPELVWRQLRKVRRPLIDLNEQIVGAQPDGAGERYLYLSPEQYEQMGEIVYQGLLGAHPGLSAAEFGNLRFTDAQLFAAFLVVRRQSGVYVELKNGEKAPEKPPGEARAETESPSGTG